MEDLIRHLTRALVDKPESVSVDVMKGGDSRIYEISVAKEDLGKLIGKKGRNINALRTILNAVASKQRVNAILEIIE